MATEIQQQFSAALSSERPLECLRTVVQALIEQGHERPSIERELEDFRIRLQQEGRDQDEDIVLDVMDFLVGWCSPHMKV